MLNPHQVIFNNSFEIQNLALKNAVKRLINVEIAQLKTYRDKELVAAQQQRAMLPRKFRIEKLTWETGEGDVFTWELAPVDGGEFYFQPGQFNMLYAHGFGEVPISICGDSEKGKLIHTTRAVGATTAGLQQLQVGDVVGIRGPFGSVWPVANINNKDLLIIAGGIGLAPLRPVIYYALNHRKKFNRVYVIYGARTPVDIIYRAELECLNQNYDIHVLISVDKASGHWDGQVGVVTNLLPNLSFDCNNAIAMICGPEVMMHFSQLTLAKAGMTDEQIYISMERNMKCAIGHCGHCQWGPRFICKDGPVFRFDKICDLFKVHEL